MNIFFLDNNPIAAAECQHDRHVVKMTLETAQLLSTAVRVQHEELNEPLNFFLDHALYKSTHRNHPSAVWARARADNFMWLLAHGFALANEYSNRYEKIHKSNAIFILLKDYYGIELHDLSVLDISPVALAMPDQYKVDCPVQSYRNYYLAEKVVNNRWRRAPEDLPDWLTAINH